MSFDETAYQKILGDELLALRLRRGWTREHLRKHLQCDKSTQTLRFYEQGARNISVLRLADLCNAMGERPHDLLARVHNRLEQPGKILLDLARVTASTHPDLAPLRNWARDRLTNQPPDSTPEQTIQLDHAVCNAMATLCGMTTAELTNHLHRTTP